MPTVDFEAWAISGLDLVLGGATYPVAPPSTEAMGKILALAVLGEVNLRIVEGPVPDEVQAVLETIGQHEHPSLGAAHQQMVDAGVHPDTINRAAYYSIYYWTHGRAYADAMARLFFEEQQAAPAAEGADAPAPKARPRSPQRSGRSTGSGNRSAKRTASPSTPTTEPHP